MTRKRLIEDIRQDPPRFYRAPADVLRDRRFADPERREILQAWRGLAPAALTADMPDTVVWLPTNSPGSAVRRTLGVLAGATVRIGRAETTSAPDDSTPDGSAGGTR